MENKKTHIQKNSRKENHPPRKMEEILAQALIYKEFKVLNR